MPSTSIGRNLTLIAIFAVFSISGLLWMSIQTGQHFGPLPPDYRVMFNVRDADAIVSGSDVRIAGIPVGKVLSVSTSDTGARVVMGIEPRYAPIYTDATVLIRPKSLLGEKYVDMTKGTSNQEVPNGGSLPDAQAFTQVELDQVLNNLDEKSRKALSVDLISLGGGLKDRGGDINATIPELRRIAEHLTPVAARFKDRTAQIDHILVDTDTILKTLADEHRQLATLLQAGDAVTGTIAANDQHLAGFLQNGSDTIARLNVAVAQQNNDANIRTSIEKAPKTLADVNALIAETGHDVNVLIPSLLLGQQYSYPADQLSIANSTVARLDREWASAFRPYDPSTGYHAFELINLSCSDGTYKCPGTYLKDSNGLPPAAQGSVPAADATALLGYLLAE
ncbi:MAG: MlaD family protein [Candidatus Dormibacteria bacterium]